MKALESGSGISTFTIVLKCKCSHLRFVAQHLISIAVLYFLVIWVSTNINIREIIWLGNQLCQSSQCHSLFILCISWSAFINVHCALCTVKCALCTVKSSLCWLCWCCCAQNGDWKLFTPLRLHLPPLVSQLFSPWYLYTIFPLISLLKFPPPFANPRKPLFPLNWAPPDSFEPPLLFITHNYTHPFVRLIYIVYNPVYCTHSHRLEFITGNYTQSNTLMTVPTICPANHYVCTQPKLYSEILNHIWNTFRVQNTTKHVPTIQYTTHLTPTRSALSNY